MADTSWQKVSTWYNKTVGDKGHYYHQHVVIPGVIRLLDLPITITNHYSLLDLACGQGVLARAIPKNIQYTGVDAAPSLINEAKNLDKNPKHKYAIADVSKPLPITTSLFTHCAIVLALQNIEDFAGVFKTAAKNLQTNGTFVIVLNHPSFRIPRQSSWEIDPQNKMQYRRINRYMSPLKIPINAHPGQQNSEMTWSFHNPLSEYIKALGEEGFVVTALEEWTSDKESEGKSAKMENRSRAEFPLFLALKATKLAVDK